MEWSSVLSSRSRLAKFAFSNMKKAEAITDSRQRFISQEFAEVVDGELGTSKYAKVTLKLKADAIPSHSRPLPVPMVVSNVFIFQDDILVGHEEGENHLNILRLVFEKLAKAGLKVNVEKCKFLQDEIKYLGFVLTKHGLSKDMDKV
ncbi:hypothetical protein ILUMI_22769 [Ignelater luminosus]|uniref:Reverse transcriptase domain-containing protein n=1 Tax=Ignelater luminosus TaxID=2038154 RepID=A0A8K0CDT3_IGNLU|nr:hypothetical protein ILUMI_22769 [Ignelater luminosus]